MILATSTLFLFSIPTITNAAAYMKLGDPVNHNTTRSNKTRALDAEGADDNSSRSNKTH